MKASLNEKIKIVKRILTGDLYFDKYHDASEEEIKKYAYNLDLVIESLDDDRAECVLFGRCRNISYKKIGKELQNIKSNNHKGVTGGVVSQLESEIYSKLRHPLRIHLLITGEKLRTIKKEKYEGWRKNRCIKSRIDSMQEPEILSVIAECCKGCSVYELSEDKESTAGHPCVKSTLSEQKASFGCQRRPKRFKKLYT